MVTVVFIVTCQYFVKIGHLPYSPADAVAYLSIDHLLRGWNLVGYYGCGYRGGYGGGYGYGKGFALIVVLFILLIIVGASGFSY